MTRSPSKPSSLKPRPWLPIGLLATWVLVNCALGNTLYALFLVAFFLILTTGVRRRFLYVAVPVVLLLQFSSPVLETWAALVKSNAATLEQFDSQIKTLLAWDSGREVLPAEVQQMLSLSRANRLETYRVGPQPWQEFEQRTVEGLWPARLDPNSRNTFRRSSDPVSPACRIVGQRETVILERCP